MRYSRIVKKRGLMGSSFEPRVRWDQSGGDVPQQLSKSEDSYSYFRVFTGVRYRIFSVIKNWPGPGLLGIGLGQIDIEI